MTMTTNPFEHEKTGDTLGRIASGLFLGARRYSVSMVNGISRYTLPETADRIVNAFIAPSQRGEEAVQLAIGIDIRLVGGGSHFDLYKTFEDYNTNGRGPVCVDYLPQNSKHLALDDMAVGSVARTLVESIGLEIERLREALAIAYESGFVDTAEGRALDKVVSILGVSRRNYAQGVVRIEVAPENLGDDTFTLPAGALFLASSSRSGVEFQSMAEVNISASLPVAEVRVQACSGYEGKDGLVEVGQIDILLCPISELAEVKVSNPQPTAYWEEENDEQMRSRVRSRMVTHNPGTIMAIRKAVRRAGGRVVRFKEGRHSTIGHLVLEVAPLAARSDTLEWRRKVRAAVHEARVAGVFIRVKISREDQG
ncbi:hypothetical protein [Desulfosediminicola flagellatus]|uniref:hypothetical protein n=1 Tax=Desulfosediminicola flagellatus TaxID=2569541 RepID=UPI0010ABA4EB|nr:hypothetical protein [Desulfosediminicola flagellatus]